MPGPPADKTADCHVGGIITVKDNTELCQVVQGPLADKIADYQVVRMNTVTGNARAHAAR